MEKELNTDLADLIVLENGQNFISLGSIVSTPNVISLAAFLQRTTLVASRQVSGLTVIISFCKEVLRRLLFLSPNAKHFSKNIDTSIRLFIGLFRSRPKQL